MSKVRVAVVGCGNVATCYIPNMKKNNQYAEVVAVCDSRIERAKELAATYEIERYYGDFEQMLREEAFDLLVNLTSMPFHEPYSRLALEAGKHVWVEKPISTELKSAHELVAYAKQQGLGLWSAPNTPASPAFRYMSEMIESGAIGKPFTAQGIYGTGGPSWGQWFYKKGGGSLFDLGVYNITTLTGLLGPAKSVVAMSGIAIPERVVEGEAITVEADDNTALILDHGNAVFSVVQTGFVYGNQMEDWSVQIIGTKGALALEGFDWEPRGVRVMGGAPGQWERQCQDQGSYAWDGGGSYIAECLATGKKPLMSGEHAVHVLEIMEATHRSALTGRKVGVESVFPKPLDL
ncbi:Gfo/Idh/MocA family protein [Paenibacillus nasutitermitis]|uniref:Oxidoreductase n=1 Tax=Paenibacillus nasutitermitis TaxID=1652958 RepID=A0A916ZCZ1_9BACL|nr:Gfo/Idh/MocA family oxidoreductase [Paenibacillus nasutitermitis]GGD87006.1 oxidoreductase [Paenibacillus nasutitermitis]